jgi:hypothetical protein
MKLGPEPMPKDLIAKCLTSGSGEVSQVKYPREEFIFDPLPKEERMSEVVCDACGKELVIGDWPFCPHGAGHSNVVGDDIPGGYEVRHGLCNEDGSPRVYYSKSEMAKEAKRRGLTNIVEHVTPPGTDKSPFTTRWI